MCDSVFPVCTILTELLGDGYIGGAFATCVGLVRRRHTFHYPLSPAQAAVYYQITLGMAPLHIRIPFFLDKVVCLVKEGAYKGCLVR